MNRSRPRCAALVPVLALCWTVHSHARAHEPAAPVPLPDTTAPPAIQPLQRQTGMRVIVGEDGQRTIIRSVMAVDLNGGDRLDFEVLDADGDGSVDRQEAAAADRNLWREFDQVDANGDGRLDREELADWIL